MNPATVQTLTGVIAGAAIAWTSSYVQSNATAHQEFNRARLSIAREVENNLLALDNDEQHINSEIEKLSNGMYDIRALYPLRHTAMDVAITKDSFGPCSAQMLTAMIEVTAGIEALNLDIQTRDNFKINSPSVSNFPQRLEGYDRLLLPVMDVNRQALKALDQILKICKWKSL